MTGSENQHRCAADSDESGPVHSTEGVRGWHGAEEDTPREDCWRAPAGHRVSNRIHRREHRAKCSRQPLCHSWPQHVQEDGTGIEGRDRIDNSPSDEDVERTDIDFSEGKTHGSRRASSEATCGRQPVQTHSVPVIQNASAACKLRRTAVEETAVLSGDQLTQQERHRDEDPGTTTDTDRQTDPTHPQHETQEEYRAYVSEVRRAGRQNFAKQTADLVRRTLQVGNWTDIARQIPLTEEQANQFLSETIETAKAEAMVIYDKHVQDKGSPQRLYKLQEALVKKAVLSLSKRCKGMSNCT